MENIMNGARSADRPAWVEDTLANYPYVDAKQIAELIRWFRKEASALDAGLIASDPLLAKPYRQFNADHLERLRGADLLRAAVFVMIASGAVLLIVWQAL